MMTRRLVAFFGIAVSLLALTSLQARPQQRYFYTDRSHARGWLGVQVQDVTHRLATEKHLAVQTGAYIGGVEDDSPAEKAGLKEGDVIVKLNGSTIEDSDDLIRTLERAKPKSDVKLDVVRGDAHKDLTVTLGRLPNSYSYSYSYSYPPMVPRVPFHFNFSFGNDVDGLVLQELSRQLADYFDVPQRRGLLVTEVKKASGAEAAGFKAGDVLVTIAGTDVADMSDLRHALRNAEDDSTLSCTVIRKGKQAKITWRVTEMDEDEDTSGHRQMHDEFLNHLREELKDLGMKLRQEFRGWKESLQNELFSS